MRRKTDTETSRLTGTATGTVAGTATGTVADAGAGGPSPGRPGGASTGAAVRRRCRLGVWVAGAALLLAPVAGAEPGWAGGTEGRGRATWEASTSQHAPKASYSWPTGGPARVLEPFDPPAVVWGSGHRGVDLALAAGSPVRAAGAGTVAFAGMVAGRPVVSIDHADSIRTTYEPVEPVVATGDPVVAGQVIGTLLSGHRADGVDALHWGARTGPKSYVNPLRLLTPAVIRLNPVNRG
ncbi:MAG: M23 family metallopeptidase [Actinomyces sp.]|uniref:M23 family metallopeptidase n=1 Tax=Actinomyces sp. TaxID=29317 RepID=UPI0026DBD4D3|nr:M23 family metallopeptidase [Actinomyces sp.]MDO4243934.1 M23 family metallopeptidase [Actinomyces sp.]